MKVSFFERRPRKTNFSIEGLFQTVKTSLPSYIIVNTVISRYFSRGLYPRIRIGFEARSRQGDVNHITGDIHFLALFLERRKTILTVHDCRNVSKKTGIRNFIFWFFWFYLPLRHLAYITVVSNATKEELLSTVEIPSEKIRVIHNCVQPVFKPTPKEFSKVRPVFLQIGTAQNKNLERLIPAMAGLLCRLVIVGRLTKEVNELLVIHEVDFSNKLDLDEEGLYAEYCAADIVTFVSTYEGFGLPIIEANAVGRPVITSNISSMPEVAGGAAWLVDPYSISSIRNGLIRLINDGQLRSHLRESGFQNVERFQADKIAQEYADLYQHVYLKSKSK